MFDSVAASVRSEHRCLGAWWSTQTICTQNVLCFLSRVPK